MHRMQSLRRRKRAAGQASGGVERAVECLVVRVLCLSRKKGRDAVVFALRQADPEIEREGLGDVPAPPIAERVAGEAPHRLVDERAEAARVVAVAVAR